MVLRKTWRVPHQEHLVGDLVTKNLFLNSTRIVTRAIFRTLVAILKIATANCGCSTLQHGINTATRLISVMALCSLSRIQSLIVSRFVSLLAETMFNPSIFLGSIMKRPFLLLLLGALFTPGPCGPCTSVPASSTSPAPGPLEPAARLLGVEPPDKKYNL